MAINGISSGSDNYFSNMLNTQSSSKTSKNNLDVSSIISGGSSGSISDLALINSGAYKKLLNAYYSKQNGGETDTVAKTEKINLTQANQDAANLSTAVADLMKLDITDENRDALKESLKSVVEKYNKVIDSASEVDNISVLRNAMWMTTDIENNAGMLKDIGIKIGEGNKLELDEEAFSKASTSTLKSMFTGKDSIMGKLGSRASLISKNASDAVSTSGRPAKTYNKQGDYNKSTTGNIIDVSSKEE